MDDRGLVLSLVDRYAFGEVAAVVSLLDDLDEGARERAERLCGFGLRLLELDAEDFDQAPGIPADLAERARRSWIPQRPDAPYRGALDSMVPAFGLMLEVIAVRWQRGEMSRALAVAHILNEYLPMLVWEAVLGHAADPARLGRHVLGPGSLWGTDERECEHGGLERKAARIAVRVAERPVAEWQSYLDRQHSHIADALAACGGFCSVACHVRTALPDAVRRTLRTRIRVARRLAGSPLVALRHAAPVGHGFGVPNESEVLTAWEQTRDRVDDDSLPEDESAVARRIRAADGFALPGLPTFISSVAGRLVPQDTLIADVRDRLAATLATRPA